jgi:2-C-methyl-D-erythritol 4-phosphate cytidylyltransferase
VLDAIGNADAAVPCVPVADTLRRTAADGVLGELVDRDDVLAMQTPQGFRRAVLVEAHANARDGAATDDAALVQALGVRVLAVPGDDAAFKITVPADLARANALFGGNA